MKSICGYHCENPSKGLLREYFYMNFLVLFFNDWTELSNLMEVCKHDFVLKTQSLENNTTANGIY